VPSIENSVKVDVAQLSHVERAANLLMLRMAGSQSLKKFNAWNSTQGSRMQGCMESPRMLWCHTVEAVTASSGDDHTESLMYAIGTVEQGHLLAHFFFKVLGLDVESHRSVLEQPC